MDSFNIENLILLMENDKITKDELLSVVNNMQFEEDANHSDNKGDSMMQVSPRTDKYSFKTIRKSADSSVLYEASHSSLNLTQGRNTGSKTSAITTKRFINELKTPESSFSNLIFSPAVNNMLSFYQSPNKSIQYKVQRVSNKDLECTFQPQRSKSTAKISYSRRLNESVIDSRSCVELNKSLQEFYERQLAFERRKEQNKQKILAEMQTYSIPKINKRSEEIAKTLVNFEERNQIFLNRSENNVMKKQEDNEYTFKPKILPVSQNMKSSSIEAMSYAPFFKKEALVNRMKKIITEQEARDCPFHPKIKFNKYSNINSKLQLRTNIRTYTIRMISEQQRRSHFNQLYKQIKEDKETKECTYKPQINQYPYYIQRVKRSTSIKKY